MDWIDVDDQMPEERVTVLVAIRTPGIPFTIAYHFAHNWHAGFGESVDVTHWMPLPEPPEKQK